MTNTIIDLSITVVFASTNIGRKIEIMELESSNYEPNVSRTQIEISTV